MAEQPITIADTWKGKAWVFGDNINTDIIIPFRFKSRTNDPYEMLCTDLILIFTRKSPRAI
jgi:3-isopropylmalate dehydratase small subunit